MRYIPVPTGNSDSAVFSQCRYSVYPCTYRELISALVSAIFATGISLYLQGTQREPNPHWLINRYIPVPTGNSAGGLPALITLPVYPCTYRELLHFDFILIETNGISLYLQGTLLSPDSHRCHVRYIPVPTGNSNGFTEIFL